MRRFLGFVRKEFFHIYRDKRSLTILLGMPVVQILLFGFAITNEINDVHVAILDKANDPASQQVIERIAASPYFQISEYITTDHAIEPLFRTGRVKAVVSFDGDFAADIQRGGAADVQVITDASEPNIASSVTGYVSAILQRHKEALNATVAVPYRMTPHTRMLFNPELKSVFMFVPGVMTVILMLVSAMMTSISIAREKELGTMEVILVTPLNPLEVILGKVFPYILLSIVNAAIILLLGSLVFGMPVRGSWVLLAGECILFIICALSLGILISTIAKTQQTAMMVSLAGLMLPVILLSGFIFPISSMPEVLQVLSNIIPARWFIEILKGIMLKGVGLSELWDETVILAGMSAGLVALSAMKYKIRLD